MERILELQKAIFLSLEKLSYRQRKLRAHHRAIRRNESKIRRAANEFLEFMVKEVRAGARKMRAKKTPSKTVDAMANWTYIKEEGRKIFNKPLLDIAAGAGDSAKRDRIRKDRTDPIGQESTAWANAYAAAMVTSITNETMKALREVIRSGIDQGLSIQAIRNQIMPIIGLNERQAESVAIRLGLLEGEGLSAAEIQRKLMRYVNKSHKYRATMIARTETAAALSEGTRIGYMDAGIKRLERVEDPDCCEICAENNGRIYNIGEAEGVLPEHPLCEGTWVIAP